MGNILSFPSVVDKEALAEEIKFDLAITARKHGEIVPPLGLLEVETRGSHPLRRTEKGHGNRSIASGTAYANIEEARSNTFTL